VLRSNREPRAGRGGAPLPRAFYLAPAPEVARNLLGCVLTSRRGRTVTAGLIVETEAYLGPEDGASHAAFRPGSHPLFYGDGGIAYVFSAYGMHACLNAITEPAGRPGCVLIRAAQPVRGLRAMVRRRGVPEDSPRLASGPGNLTSAFGITLADSGADLTRGSLTIQPPEAARDFEVASGPRIGITRSRDLPLRFWIAGHPHVSRPRGDAAWPSSASSPDRMDSRTSRTSSPAWNRAATRRRAPS
jgi:DNA-3-methyladenine glycosylase